VKNLSILGLYWGSYYRIRPDLVAASFERIVSWYQSGKIAPHISHTLPLEQAGEGLALLRNRKATGKVVIEVA